MRATAGAVVMLPATCTAILDVRANALVPVCFLAPEVLAAGVVAFLGFVHAERPDGPAAVHGGGVTAQIQRGRRLRARTVHDR